MNGVGVGMQNGEEVIEISAKGGSKVIVDKSGNVTVPGTMTANAVVDGAGAVSLQSTLEVAGAVTHDSTVDNKGAVTNESTTALQGTVTISDAKNVVVGTSTGTKIGTATGQKLGFWNATPVVQQVLATGASKTVDDVITLLQTLGLCKQS